MSAATRPPRLANRLLRRLAPGREGDAIAGDLDETFHARGGGRAWYWLEVVACARVRIAPWYRAIPDLRQDLPYALRILRRNPGYAAVAMLCLALGMGVNAAVFSVLDGIYTHPLPVAHSDRMVAIDRNGGMPCSWRDYLAFRSEPGAFAGVAATQARGTFMDIERANFDIVAETVSANYAEVLGVKAALGRWFQAGDEAPAAEPAVVISARLWQRYFERDRAVLGRSVRIEGQWYKVIGVAPEEFRGVSPPVPVDAWVPLAGFPILRAQLADGRGAGPEVALTGRLAPGESVQHAAAGMAVMDARIRQRHPREPRYAMPLTLRPFRGIASPGSRRSMHPIATLLTAIAAIVLLIACVNIANLLLARAAVRQREMALRRALGASRGRLLRQGLAEGAVLAAGGAAAGILSGYWTDRALSLWAPASIPQAALRGIHLEMNWRVALATAAAGLLCAALFSLAPAMARDARGGRRGISQRDLYVVAQVALSMVLLTAAGLFLRAFQAVARIDPGFATGHRMYVRLFTPEPDFTPESSTALFTRLLQQAGALPSVRQATLSFGVLGFSDSECVEADRASPPGRADINVVEPNYFEVMRVPILRGRNFDASDQGRSPRAIVVNETMARQRWGGREAIGQTVWLGCSADRTPPAAARVIGVVRDSKYGSLDEEPRPLFYVSRRQVWWNGFFALIVHTDGDPRALAGPLIRLARTGGPDLRIYEIRTFDDLLALSLWRLRWQAALVGALGLLAVTLSVAGLYGVVAYTVAQRTREIGVRMALGAQKMDVQWMVLARGLRLSAAGIAMGAGLSAIATRFLGAFLYGVSALDATAFGAASLAWILIAMVASYVPARRAARVDAAVSLRYE